MKVSIIVPVYNVESYIQECLTSIIAQTYEGEIECLIIDDCGTDASMETVNQILDSYVGNIDFKIIRHPYNKGLSAARNTGIKAAVGEYVTFVDSDDKLFPESIYNLIQAQKNHPTVDIVQGDVVVETPRTNSTYLAISGSRFPLFTESETWLNRNFLDSVPAPVWAKLIHKDFIIRNNLFFSEGRLHEDEVWRLEASRYVKSMAFCFSPVYFYRTGNETSIMNQKDQTKLFEDHLYLIQKILHDSANTFRTNEIIFAIGGLNYRKKAVLWSQINNRGVINQRIRNLIEVANASNSPSVIKFMVWYLSLPIWIGNNIIISRLYNLLVRFCSKNIMRANEQV